MLEFFIIHPPGKKTRLTGTGIKKNFLIGTKSLRTWAQGPGPKGPGDPKSLRCWAQGAQGPKWLQVLGPRGLGSKRPGARGAHGAQGGQRGIAAIVPSLCPGTPWPGWAWSGLACEGMLGLQKDIEKVWTRDTGICSRKRIFHRKNRKSLARTYSRTRKSRVI